MQYYWLLMSCMVVIGCTANPSARTENPKEQRDDEVSQKIQERNLQMDVRLGNLERRMERMEQTALALMESIRQLDGRIAQSRGESRAAVAEARLPDLPVVAGKNEKWTEKHKVNAAKIIKKLETTTAAQEKPKHELIGNKMPIVRFITSDGALLDIGDYRGQKKVLLVILRGFAGSVCLVCSSQTIALSHSIEEFKKRNTEVILVYPGEANTVPGFLEAVRNLEDGFKPPFAIALDVEFALIDEFKIRGNLAKPTSILIDEQGTVRYAYVGDNAADRPPVQVLLDQIDKAGGPQEQPRKASWGY